jgi:hypothetical protein
VALNKFLDGLGQTVRNYRRFDPNRQEPILDGFGQNRPQKFWTVLPKTVQNLVFFFFFFNYYNLLLFLSSGQRLEASFYVLYRSPEISTENRSAPVTTIEPFSRTKSATS